LRKGPVASERPGLGSRGKIRQLITTTRDTGRQDALLKSSQPYHSEKKNDQTEKGKTGKSLRRKTEAKTVDLISNWLRGTEEKAAPSALPRPGGGKEDP